MKVVVTHRERYPNFMERSKVAQQSPKYEQKVRERYTESGVALPKAYEKSTVQRSTSQRGELRDAVALHHFHGSATESLSWPVNGSVLVSRRG